ncbi:MAG: ATP-binding protein [Gammaproteobacteria bacterium]
MTWPLRFLTNTLLSVLLCTALLPFAAQAQPPLVESLTLLDDFESVFWPEGVPPQSAPWQPATLPYNTREKSAIEDPRAQDSSYIWFRFYVNNPMDNDAHGLYFWRFNLAIDVYFNSHLLASSPQSEGWETMSWNHPMLVPIQAPSWQQGKNEVLVRVTRSPWGGNLAPIVYGDMKSLTPLYESRMLRQVELNEILLILGIGLCLMSFMLWVVRPRETVYLWFSGMCLSWSLITLHLVILRNPIPYAIWLPLVHIAIDFSIFFMYGFIGRLIDQVKKPFREQLFLLWCLCAAVSYFFLPPQYFFSVVYSIHLVGIIFLSIIVARVSKTAIHERNTPAIVVTVALFIQIALFAQNYYLMFFSSAAQWEGNAFYAHFGIPLLFLVFIGTLLWRFHGALTVAENINKQLESKVEASRQVIEKSYFERRQLELQQAAEKERLNIYRDLHDDVGSKLLSIVHADRNSNLADMARSALESLRHAVSKANNPDQAIAPFLQDIQEETELRLQGSGHEVQWSQSIADNALIVPSKAAFTINRILKEVVSNIIRHASADHVEIQIRCDEEQWIIQIKDNGRGFDRHGPMGNGINNILSRAEEINAIASWETTFDHGTDFTLSLSARVLQHFPQH